MIGLVVIAVGLSACGRRGPLEPPPSSLVSQPGYAPGVYGPVPGYTDEEKPKRRFFLDFLL